MIPDPSLSAAELRRQAEARLHSRTPHSGVPSSAADNERLLHELQVHQIELEMQNEELRKARNELETVAARYAELYDFAPVGYITLDPSGQITQANLAVASLMDTERAQLTDKRFASFVAEGDLRVFDQCLSQLLAGGPPKICEVALADRSVQINATRSNDGLECRLVM